MLKRGYYVYAAGAEAGIAVVAPTAIDSGLPKWQAQAIRQQLAHNH